MDYKFFKNRKNYIQSFEGVLHLHYFPAIATGQLLKKRLGIGYQSIISTGKKNFCQWFYDQNDLIRLTNYLLKKTKSNPLFIQRLIGLWKKDLKKFNSICCKIDQFNLNNLSESQLIKLYQEFCQAYYLEWSISIIADAISIHSESLARHQLLELLKEKQWEKKFAEFFPILTATLKPSFATQQKMELLRILAKLPKHLKGTKTIIENKRVGNLLSQHAQKYHWIQNSYLMARNLTAKDFAIELQEMIKEKKKARIEIKKIYNQLLDLKVKKQKLIKKLGIAKDLRLIFRIIESFAWIQDERKKYNLIGDHYLSLFLRQVAKRLKSNYFKVAYATPEELIKFLKQGKVNSRLLKQRRKLNVLIVTASQIRILVGRPAQRIAELLTTAIKKNISEIRGQCASIGKIEGIVRVIRTMVDLKKMRRGDILVSSMTRPELLPGIKKAGGIITDEGGITSHAAIVSREFNIPCVIGTKIATKVLKDGDLVELNANHGVIKILK